MSSSKELLEVAEMRAKASNKKGSATDKDVLEALRALKKCWPTQERANVAPGGYKDPTVRGLFLGLSPNRSGGCAISQVTKACPELTKLVTSWVEKTLGDKEFRYGSVQVNYNYAARKHIDSNNLGPSYIISLGNHKGGELWTADRGILDCKGAWRLFDGNTEHMTQPYEGDERISFILFTPDAYNRLQPEVARRAVELGFTAASTARTADDAYFAKFRDLGDVDEDEHVAFTEKHHQDNPPSFGSGAISVETNGYAAGRGWGWISWQARGKDAAGVEVEHFRKNATGIHVVELEAQSDATLRKVSAERFNLYQNTAAESSRWSSWVKKLPPNRVVAVCITDTAMAKTRPLPPCVYEAFRSLGAPTSLTLIGYREPFAFVGYKGAPIGTAVHVIDAKKQSKQLLRIDANFALGGNVLRLENIRTSELKLLEKLGNDSTAPPKKKKPRVDADADY